MQPCQVLESLRSKGREDAFRPVEGWGQVGLIGVTGLQGSGKTLFCVQRVLYRYCKLGLYESCYSNVRIHPYNGREVTLLDKETFKHIGEVRNALVVIDESYLWLDSRSSMSKENKAITYLILQSRKRHFDVLWNAQLSGSVDKRMRGVTETLVRATKTKFGFKYFVFRRRAALGNWYLSHSLSLPYGLAEKIYPYYDSDEIVPIV